MIRLPDHIKPKTETLKKLAQLQKEIDDLPTFEERSAHGKVKFSATNKIGNKTFDDVKKALTLMCSGAKRCCYCEDSVADEVEHIKPKDLYPGHCFDWNNYLYACGPCNGPKNNLFAVFRQPDGLFVEVNPPRGQAATEPPVGHDALINPRTEDPMLFAMLDLVSTFRFVPLHQEGTQERIRAEYTFDKVLRLNSRNDLAEAREEAFGDYKARFVEYDSQKSQGATQQKLDKLVRQLQKKGHPTVWREIKRYHQRGILKNVDANLNTLFIRNPEALTW
jgi:5-methylcytosine-specific restriction endonuclease McrA